MLRTLNKPLDFRSSFESSSDKIAQTEKSLPSGGSKLKLIFENWIR